MAEWTTPIHLRDATCTMARYKSRQEVQLCRGNANSMPNPRQMEAVNPRDQTDANLGKHEKSQISWATERDRR